MQQQPHWGRGAHSLSSSAEQMILAAIKRCECKIMIADPDGSHREIKLDPGSNSESLLGTRCHICLEAIQPDLRQILNPQCIADFVVDRVNLYVSNGGCGTPLHFDCRDILVVQLGGAKLWRYSSTSAVQNPKMNFVAPSTGDEALYCDRTIEIPRKLKTVILEPGDWLFLPKAVWHETFTYEGSISATLAAPE